MFFHGSFKILRKCNNYWNISFDIFLPVKRYFSVKSMFLAILKKPIYSSFIILYCSSLTTKHFHFSTLITKHKKLEMISLSSSTKHKFKTQEVKNDQSFKFYKAQV